MSDCIFCKIVSGEIPCTKIYENDYLIAIEDINPKAKVHSLIIPKVHVDSFNELEDEKLMAELLKGIKKVCAIKDLKSYRLHVNTGKAEGQIVFHLHIHILSNTIK
ncbi:MAG TPA: HIT domain-containing protein [Candidatus Gastranaerophilaceae bacterium]|nr:HIT domain-containing protein [Candidatus Gastranaerophilaceae bacterium]HPT42084.1 HIT domain-containing protein [Candidatus Gastranaerophilaceae bacterium]